MSKTGRWHEDSGYTIVELLVVLLLVGIITAGLAGALTFASRLWERSESRIALVNDQSATQEILRTLIASAVPRTSDGRVSLQGEPDRLSFEAPAPAAFETLGLAHIELFTERADDRTRLMVRISSEIDLSKHREAILLDQVNDVEFAYLDSSETVSAWLSYWRNRDRMPDAVRLQDAATGAPASWPSVVVRLPIAQGAICAFDAVSRECRKQ
jgi:prepilin-type N-terminal cleavage/methylation domain-containing protein